MRVSIPILTLLLCGAFISQVAAQGELAPAVADGETSAAQDVQPAFASIDDYDDLLTENIFSNPRILRQWLGEKPRFVYRSRGKADPMLIPWLFAEYEAQMRLEEAEKLWDEKGKSNWEKALRIYREVLKKFPNTTAAKAVGPKLERYVSDFEKRFAEKHVEKEPVQVARFPEWVKTKFTSMMFSRDGGTIMIDGNIYQDGDIVRGTETEVTPVKILEIKKGINGSRDGFAIFEFNNKQYYYGPKGAVVPGAKNPD